jgi:hypothetical protein
MVMAMGVSRVGVSIATKVYRSQYAARSFTCALGECVAGLALYIHDVCGHVRCIAVDLKGRRNFVVHEL